MTDSIEKAAVTPEPRKGKVYRFVWTDKKGLVPFSELQKADVTKRTADDRRKSKQIKTDSEYMTDNGLIPLPFAATSLFELQENCSYFDACVRQIAKDVVGQGFDIKTRAGHEKGQDGDGTDPGEADREKRKQELIDFFEDPNTEEDSLEDILERMIIDWGVTGWFGLEVGREGADIKPEPQPEETQKAADAMQDPNAEGPLPTGKKQVTLLYHVPGHTIRVHSHEHKYCQIRGIKRRWFKRFGYEEDVNADNGTETGDERDKLHVEKIPPELLAHEMIFYKNYYPLSSWYGVPNILPAVGSMRSLIGIRDYNLAFFENYGIPAAIVTVTGEWDEEAIKNLTTFINVEIKGAGNAHKTIVLNPPEAGTVEWVPIATAQNQKEGSFRVYLKNLRDEVLVCYKMPAYRIGITETGSLGGSTAAESTQIYISSIVNPLKRVLNHIMSQKIIKEGFGYEDLVFELKPLDARDVDALTKRMQILFSIGAVTRMKIAEEMGLPAIDPKKDPTADKYYVLNTYVGVGSASAADDTAKSQAAFQGLQEAMEKAVGDNNRYIEQLLVRAKAQTEEETEIEAPGTGAAI